MQLIITWMIGCSIKLNPQSSIIAITSLTEIIIIINICLRSRCSIFILFLPIDLSPAIFSLSLSRIYTLISSPVGECGVTGRDFSLIFNCFQRVLNQRFRSQKISRAAAFLSSTSTVSLQLNLGRVAFPKVSRIEYFNSKTDLHSFGRVVSIKLFW